MPAEREPHVTVEMRRVYRSARGRKLSRHAAYVDAAKELIARACERWGEARFGRDEYGFAWCSPDKPCRFHKKHECEEYGYDGEPIGDVGMLYYVRVKTRLVRFLKHVDRRAAEAASARGAGDGE